MSLSGAFVLVEYSGILQLVELGASVPNQQQSVLKGSKDVSSCQNIALTALNSLKDASKFFSFVFH